MPLASSAAISGFSKDGIRPSLSRLVQIYAYRDNDVAFLVSLLDIPVRLDDLFQRIDPVNDRSELPRLDEFFEHEQNSSVSPPLSRRGR